MSIPQILVSDLDFPNRCLRGGISSVKPSSGRDATTRVCIKGSVRWGAEEDDLETGGFNLDLATS